ncbi:MAG: HD domain-containing protein [Chitinophagia bacterium]|nr:HD domain-containing protein [Chitinophagia bacterium]
MKPKVKIINDPVYGFLRFPEPEIIRVLDHPWFQRLRNIKQMGMAQLVYPGAVHTRLHHSLGACHLMGKALDELRLKGVEITREEVTGARLAALLHDVGHGPFSHSLEHTLVSVPHEKLSLLIMQHMNKEFGGLLDKALSIFQGTGSSDYLHQLVSSQLDVDRMDYLTRDSFFTGVSEGVIGYDRILQMLTVRNNQLMVEEKGVYSVEKFIIARRLMYWQVYLHKTVLAAEMLLINILRRARELALDGADLFATPVLRHFLYQQLTLDDFLDNPNHIAQFCKLDDADVLAAIKVWQNYPDAVLSRLCQMLVLRKLYKILFVSESLANILGEKMEQFRAGSSIDERHLHYFVFEGIATNNTYNVNDELIWIDTKAGGVKNITEIEGSLVNQALAGAVSKSYVCYTLP